MTLLQVLASLVIGLWALSEVLFRLLSLINRPQGELAAADRYSVIVVWLATVPPMFVAFLIYVHVLLPDGFGSFAALTLPLAYLGCLVSLCGLTIRWIAVVTLKRQFAVTVSFVEQHTLIQTGLYRLIRHPAYLGWLTTGIGFGLLSGNWLGLAVLVVPPLAGVLYRIHVEELALQQRFGTAYVDYARRAKRLLPGIY